MKRFYSPAYTLRRWLLAPLVYVAALFLLFEEWLWAMGSRTMQGLAQFPPLHALEHAIRGLPPYWALAAFVLPALLLFPVKLLALMAIANGHAWTGVSVIVIAKLGGAATVARIYALTRPTLLTLPWFARYHGRFMAFKDRCIARLLATPAWQQVSGMSRDFRLARQRAWTALRAHLQGRRGRHNTRPARVLRRFAAFWRARRR